MIINFLIGTGWNTFDNAADVCMAKTVVVQLVKPSLIASLGIKDNTPKETGKCTYDIQE